MAANPLRADELSQLILTLNEGLLSKRPWNGFLGGVARKLDAFAASLMLRSPTFGERGLMYNYGGYRTSRSTTTRSTSRTTRS